MSDVIRASQSASSVRQPKFAPAFTLLLLVAVAAAVARRPSGESYLPAWLELCLELPVLLGYWVDRRCPDRIRLMRRADVLIVALVLTGAVAIAAVQAAPRAIGLSITVYLAGTFLIDWLTDWHRRLSAVLEQPGRMLRAILPSWFALICAGAVLLSIPLATQSGVPDYRHNFLNHVLDSFFAAASAASLVGLTIQSFGEDYTAFGQAVLLVMTQISGMVFAAAGLAIVRPFLSRQLCLSTIWLAAAALQCIALVVMFPVWTSGDAGGALARVGWSLAYAVSALWNTSLSLRTDGLATYFTEYRVVMSVTTLAIAGSLGLPILLDLLLPQPPSINDGGDAPKSFVQRRFRKLPEFEAIVATLLLALAAALLWYFEHPGSRWSLRPERPFESVEHMPALQDVPAGQRWPLSLMISATLRSAGLQSIPVSQGALSWQSFGLLLMMMMLGGSAAGVAGGMRTTALSIILMIRPLRTFSSGGHGVRQHVVGHVLLFVLAMLVMNAAATGLLLMATDGTAYECILEATSAVNNVGLSTGLSLHLTPPARLSMIALFILGRLVPLYFWLRLSDGLQKVSSQPNESN